MGISYQLLFVDFGYTGGQCYQRKIKYGLSEPRSLKGTQGEFGLKMLKLFSILIDDHFSFIWSHMSQQRLNDFAGSLDPQIIIEYMRIVLSFVTVEKSCKSFHLVKYHGDEKNDPRISQVIIFSSVIWLSDLFGLRISVINAQNQRTGGTTKNTPSLQAF